MNRPVSMAQDALPDDRTLTRPIEQCLPLPITPGQPPMTGVIDKRFLATTKEVHTASTTFWKSPGRSNRTTRSYLIDS
ncbi:hypothetical protein N656DRAFT_785401 [Canariomyces notabilis]|uniref:Uncharacterized protein n=1 Tax=Canariomyces notabilis TaxID=2074819 RepID=A0AAN6QBS7_9PEZI|nr:hypothetical protein N656DRAFT_785401 [Canariomyces arenarius]